MNVARDWNMPVRVLLDDGTYIPVFPNRAISAVETGKESSDVWHFDADGIAKKVTIFAEIEHVRAALGLDDED